jgi:hypothetical protein
MRPGGHPQPTALHPSLQGCEPELVETGVYHHGAAGPGTEALDSLGLGGRWKRRAAFDAVAVAGRLRVGEVTILIEAQVVDYPADEGASLG